VEAVENVVLLVQVYRLQGATPDPEEWAPDALIQTARVLSLLGLVWMPA
jgi:hypothetical protein